ncbi:MAG: F0F1 ATP synthase subunit B [Gordonia sp. (in: high G+C Gram-positive bacteria)]|uniref:F0F1 ATP synthase subunit B n=1 Tax=Gordonia sp. (in: high G+C Gram-positive bacteria) TaxID=84139 RepID=UPI0039E2E87B
MININLLAEAAQDTGNPDPPPNPLVPYIYDITWSLVAFLVLLFVFWKYVIPMYRKVLDERRDAIEGGIERAQAAQDEAAQALAAYQQQLAGAREEANAIREDARTQGNQILADMKDQAQSESDRIVANGNAQLEAQRQQVVTELRGHVGQMSVDLAEKLVGAQLSDGVSQAGTVDRFLAELDDVSGTAAK